MNDSVISPTEQSIKYMKEDKKELEKASKANVLENVENTIVYKLDELRSFKISPIKNEEKIQIVDDEAIKEEIKNSEANKLTSQALEAEISKTTYIKELREKIEKLEAEEAEKAAIKEKELKEIKKAEKAEKEQKKKVKKPIVPKKIVAASAHSRKRAVQYNKKSNKK